MGSPAGGEALSKGLRCCPRIVLPFFAALVVLLAVVPAAQATFHLIKVREVLPSSGESSYVELQMYAGDRKSVV